jgi:hypothetical protein
MFSIDSGDFLNDPLSFGFNTTKHIFLVLIFMELLDVKRTQTFFHVIFSGF